MLIGDIVIGILGALAGGFLFSHLGFAGSGGIFYSIFVAFLGAVILTWLFRPGYGKSSLSRIDLQRQRAREDLPGSLLSCVRLKVLRLRARLQPQPSPRRP